MVDKIINENIYTNGLTERQFLNLINNQGSNKQIAGELQNRVHTGITSIIHFNEPPSLSPIKRLNVDEYTFSPYQTPIKKQKTRYIYIQFINLFININ